MKTARIASALGIAFALCATSQAAAAPQALGLIATAQPAPFQCSFGECAVELSAICLQPHRASPARGARYLPADTPQRIVVTAETAEGRTRVPLTEIVFTAFRSHTAVKASISPLTMRARGWSDLEISVEPHVTLLPTNADGDGTQLGEDEVALVTGPLRRIAAGYVDESDGPRISAARLTGRIINRLPIDDVADAGRRDAVVRQVLDDPEAPGDASARAMARSAVADCGRRIAGPSYTMRQCLGQKHDHFIGKLNNAYWDGLSAGM